MLKFRVHGDLLEYLEKRLKVFKGVEGERMNSVDLHLRALFIFLAIFYSPSPPWFSLGRSFALRARGRAAATS